MTTRIRPAESLTPVAHSRKRAAEMVDRSIDWIREQIELGNLPVHYPPEAGDHPDPRQGRILHTDLVKLIERWPTK